MTTDLAKLTLEQKREVVLRYAARYHEALVSLEEPRIDAELEKYARWDRSDWSAPDADHL